MQPLDDAIMREMERPGVGLTLWIGGDPKDWDLDQWQALSVVRRLVLRDQPVEIIAPRQVIARADQDLRIPLFGLLMKSGAVLRATDTPLSIGPGAALARVGDEQAGTVWACRRTEANIPGSDWGTSAISPVVRGRHEGTFDRGTPLDPGSFLQMRPDTVLIDIGSELDGRAAAFGANFWRLLTKRAPLLAERIAAKDELTELHYSDRYLVSPLPVRLVQGILAAAPGLSPRTLLKLETMDASSQQRHPGAPYLIDHNWSVETHAAGVTEMLLRRVSKQAEVERRDRRDLPHSRTMTLRFAQGGLLRVILDQGAGYWRTDGRVRFDFTQGVTGQVAELGKTDFRIVAGTASRTCRMKVVRFEADTGLTKVVVAMPPPRSSCLPEMLVDCIERPSQTWTASA